jgi:pantoate--beta-alanine ligase
MHAPLQLASSVDELRGAVVSWRKAGLSVGFVPTMGALHEGHLSLVRLAKTRCDRVAASLFVNPRQFAPHEDFERYPRDEAADAALLAGVGCDLLYTPTRASMYPEGFATNVIVSDVSTPLEGEFRPHFFGGVATVVAKLLIQAAPDAAFFGEKDYQQLLVVKRMARDLDLPAEIVGCPTVREPDGLAMSSRNAYLSGKERQIALALHAAMQEGAHALRSGALVDAVEIAGAEQLRQAGFSSVDYFAVRDAATLGKIADPAKPVRILAAAWVGKTRLIDNIAV